MHNYWLRSLYPDSSVLADWRYRYHRHLGHVYAFHGFSDWPRSRPYWRWWNTCRCHCRHRHFWQHHCCYHHNSRFWIRSRKHHHRQRNRWSWCWYIPSRICRLSLVTTILTSKLNATTKSPFGGSFLMLFSRQTRPASNIYCG